MKRRNFVKQLGVSSLLLSGMPVLAKGSAQKRVLILGGTNYLGPAIVQVALDAGYEVTLFNRGLTNPDLFPGVEKLVGDRSIRSEDLSALVGNRKWDHVIDTWPSDPRMIAKTASMLKGRVSSYSFISSIAVYADKTQQGIDEGAPLHKVETFEEGMSYYHSKVLCEKEVLNKFPDNHLIVRPPGIHGKRDESWTLVYWLWRIRRGGDVLAPGNGTDPLQFIDVNDVASFMVQAIAANHLGVFNCMGPRKDRLNWQEFLNRINSFYGNKARLVWVSKDFLARKSIRPVVDLPMWEPIERRAGRHTMDATKAINTGLKFRPMEETFESAMTWYDQVMSPEADPGLDKRRPFNGITRERELTLLEEWRSENN